MKDAQAITLDYSTTSDRGASPYRLAMIALVAVCLPLVVGLGTTVLYVLSGYGMFAVIGILMVPTGLLLLLSAIVLAGIATHQNRRGLTADDPRVGRLMNRMIAVSLLSIPVGIGCAAAGLIAPPRFGVQVANTGPTPVQNVRLDLAGKRLTVGTLAPGQNWKSSFRPDSGPAKISWTVAGSRHEKELANYTDADSFWTGASFTIDGEDATWN